MNIGRLSRGKYVVAVSGGVDSVVLLDLLKRQAGLDLVVAHFNHGIRGRQSDADARFVADLAADAGLKFELGRGNLGPNASEAAARRARYAFLRRVRKKYHAEAIVTAHQRDDLIETALINLLRSGGIRSLTSLRSRPGLARPLLGVPKSRLLAYARRAGLSWREDSTNQDARYLRNYLRLKVLSGSRAAPAKQKMLMLIQRQTVVINKIEHEVAKILEAGELAEFTAARASLSRYWLAMLPYAVAAQLLAAALAKLPGSEPRLLARQTCQLLVWARVGKPGRRKSIGPWRFYLTKRRLIVEHSEN